MEEETSIIQETKEKLEIAHKKKKIRDKIKRELEEAESEYSAALKDLSTILIDEGLDRFDADNCFISFTERTTVTTPKREEDKKAFFEWLDSRGLLLNYLNINYNSLQSLHKAEKELGRTIPGVGEEKTFRKPQIYDKK